jgi:hypothetical protein
MPTLPHLNPPDPSRGQTSDADDSLIEALELAEEIEAVAALLGRFSEISPSPFVRSTSRNLCRTARSLALQLAKLIDDAQQFGPATNASPRTRDRRRS